MAETYASIVAGCQIELEDYDGQLWTSSVLLRAINFALEDVRLDLTAAGVSRLRRQGAIALPASTLEVSKTTTPALPADFSAPLKLLERPSGSTNPAEWQEVRLVEDIAADAIPVDVLSVYAFQEGMLKFRGATVARELRLDYLADIPDFTGGTDALPVELTLAPLIYLTLAHVVRASDKAAAAEFRRDAERALSRVRAVDAKQKQMLLAQRHSRRGRVRNPRLRPPIV